MKTNLLTSSLMTIALCSAFVPAAHAADGTITFTGEILEQTCTISNNGNYTVAMGSVPKSQLSAAGQDATSSSNFAIELSLCPASNIHAYFEHTSTVDDTTGMLKVGTTSTDAKNVEIELLNAGDQSFINLANADAQQNSKPVVVSTAGGSATLPYIAKYHATGVASEGHANSQVEYTLRYN